MVRKRPLLIQRGHAPSLTWLEFGALPHPACSILEDRIAAMMPELGSSLIVMLETATAPILARVTQAAVRDLSIQPGKPAWAVIKAHA